MSETQKLMIRCDEMYDEIQKLRETIHQLKEYGEELVDVKPDSWFPFSNRPQVSNEIGRNILMINRGERQQSYPSRMEKE